MWWCYCGYVPLIKSSSLLAIDCIIIDEVIGSLGFTSKWSREYGDETSLAVFWLFWKLGDVHTGGEILASLLLCVSKYSTIKNDNKPPNHTVVTTELKGKDFYLQPPNLYIRTSRCEWCRRVTWLIQAGQRENRIPGETEKRDPEPGWKCQLHAKAPEHPPSSPPSPHTARTPLTLVHF